MYNPELAVKVLFELKKTYKNATLCMIGPNSDPSFDTVKKLILDLDLSSNVEVTGRLSKEKWHEKSIDFDIFINTSNVDNTPISLIESMALGMPIISTNVGGIPFLLEDGKEGVLVEKENEFAMTEAILDLINSNSMQIQLNARRKAELFDSEIVSDKWLKLLK
jgi:glycosyltransferase involved in cell wall biosynthesis